MRKLKLLMAACALVGSAVATWAQTADVYFPSVFISNVSDELSAATTADVANFSALSGDYTIEVAGTVGTEITFPYDRYRTVSYTPSVSGTIRFVSTESKVFVYEKESTTFVYKGKATISSITWPAMETANVSDPTNILGNPDFQVYGDKISDGRYKLGSPWQISDESLYGSGFREGTNSNSHDNGVTPTNCFVWRTDDSKSGYKGKYFYQEVTLSPNSKYFKYRIRTSENTNGQGKYSIRLGSTPGGNEYSSATFTIAKDATNNVASGDLTIDAEIGEHSYFSIYNAYDYNKSSNFACTQIDLIQLVEATTASTTIGGASEAKYVTEAVSPICEGNATAKISNPFIESGTSGWTNGRTNNGQQYTGAPGGTYMDTYGDTRDQYQQITLPAGVYTIKAATRAIATLQIGYIYAQIDGNKIGTADVHKDGNTGGALGNGWGWTETTFVVPTDGATVRIGFYSECGGSLWAGADEFYLTYKGTTLPSDMCTALLDEVVDGKMNATIASAQTSAKTAFEGEKNTANYYALRVAINNAAASVAAYTKGKAAIDKANDIMSKTNVYTADAYSTFSGVVATAESKYADDSWTDSEATTFATSTLGNGYHSTASVDDFLISAWDVTARNWSDYHVNTWSTTEDSGNPNLVVPAIQYWGEDASALADKVMAATVAVEPYETYKVAAFISIAKNTTAYGEDATTAPVGVTLQVGDGAATTCTGTRVGETRFFEDTFEATGEADGSGNLTIKIAVASTDASWIMFRDVKYTKQPAAEATFEEKAALLAAINEAKANTIGFEENEYAPYNNIEATAMLATAETVYANSTTKPAINGTKDALKAAIWTKNDEELNAFYDGTFATREVQETSKNGTKIPGWTSGDNIRQILKTVATFPGLDDATDKTALFAWSGGATYGSDLGYEMPLKADTYYRLTIKVAGWNNETRGNINVSVLKDSEGLASTNLGKADKDISAGMTTMTKVFKTGAAGNYIFSISSSHNIVFTDVELFKAVATEITIAEDAPEAPAISDYANVTLNRSFNAGWNAVCLPFATEAFDGAQIAEFTGETIDGDNVTLNFTKVDAFEANKPYLVYFPAAVAANKTFSGVAVAPAEVKKTGEAFDFMGTFIVKDVDAGNWVVSGGALKKASTTISLKPTRTYFAPKTAGARIAGFVIDDDETTGIAVIENEGKIEIVNSAYNLNGQKMNGQLKKGVYIINGKKTVVK